MLIRPTNLSVCSCQVFQWFYDLGEARDEPRLARGFWPRPSFLVASFSRLLPLFWNPQRPYWQKKHAQETSGSWCLEFMHVLLFSVRPAFSRCFSTRRRHRSCSSSVRPDTRMSLFLMMPSAFGSTCRMASWTISAATLTPNNKPALVTSQVTVGRERCYHPGVLI